MRLFTLCALLATAMPAFSQAVIGVVPGRNTVAAPPLTPVVATLATVPPAGAAASLRVFSQQAGGLKAGTTTSTGATVRFAPAAAFRPGELVTAVVSGGGGSAPQAWQFTGAATGGSGHFSLSSQLPMRFDYFSYDGLMRLADVDNDGDLDLLTMGYSNLPTTTQVLVRLNDGQGAFTAGWSTTIPMAYDWQWKCQLEVADIDGDGDLDILCSGALASMYVFTNDGSGSFQLQATVHTAAASWNLATGDVDADGDIDFVATEVGSSSHSFSTAYTVGLNKGDGTFTTKRLPSDNGSISSLRDIDNNGTLDAIEELMVPTGPATSTGTPTALVVVARLNSGQGDFTATKQLTAVTDSLDTWVFTDFDNDNDLDLLLVTRSCATCGPKLKVCYNNGSGSFGASTAISTPGILPTSKKLAVADIDGDGDEDLLLTGQANVVLVLRNSGHGTFEPAASYPSPGQSAAYATAAAPVLALGDLDGDGDIDIAAPVYPVDMSQPQFINILRNDNSVQLAATPTTQPAPAQVWPNPAAAGSATLEIKLATPVAGGVLRLTTSLGQVVRTQPLTGTSAEVALQGLAPGLYLLTVQGGGQAPFSQRVVLR